jgi:hypothetical protein
LRWNVVKKWPPLAARPIRPKPRAAPATPLNDTLGSARADGSRGERIARPVTVIS